MPKMYQYIDICQYWLVLNLRYLSFTDHDLQLIVFLFACDCGLYEFFNSLHVGAVFINVLANKSINACDNIKCHRLYGLKLNFNLHTMT